MCGERFPHFVSHLDPPELCPSCQTDADEAEQERDEQLNTEHLRP